jgi:tripartite-type tricarboxylate transporter receptor subunit TctC
VVPYPPGASTDNMARAFAQELSKELKTPVVTENKPGAGTAIGALAVKGQPADGYTLLFQTEGLLVAKLTNPSLGYETSDFETVAALSKTPFVLAVPTQRQARTLDDLKALAATKNNELDFGTLGSEISQYAVLSHNLSQQLGVKEKMIYYKGGMEGITAVMAGEIDGYFATVSLTSSQKDNPKLTLLAVTSEGAPSKFLPNVKSFKELGIKDMTYNALYGISVLSATPEAIKKQLKEAARHVTDSDAVKQTRNQIALEEFSGTLQEFDAEQKRGVQMLYNYAQEQKAQKR